MLPLIKHIFGFLIVVYNFGKRIEQIHIIIIFLWNEKWGSHSKNAIVEFLLIQQNIQDSFVSSKISIKEYECERVSLT